jgi:hypothetical protein
MATKNSSLDPRLHNLHEELRTVLFDGLSNLSPSRPLAELEASGAASQRLDFSSTTVKVPQARLIRYLQNWITDCAPQLDKFDEEQHFQIEVPLVAQRSPALLYAILAFSSRQMERRGLMPGHCDSLELYQESIRLLAPALQAKDSVTLITACVLAVFELMSSETGNWRRHVEGCASLFEVFGVNGFSGGLLQAVFWCYARMELCGSFTSDGAETMVLAPEKWVPNMNQSMVSPKDAEKLVSSMFREASRESHDMHANWSIYLCAKVCDLKYRKTQYLELGRSHGNDDRPFSQQWQALWTELQFWLDERPATMKPTAVAEGDGGDENNNNSNSDNPQTFPTLVFPHWAAISSNQVYHAACISMLGMQPPDALLNPRGLPSCTPHHNLPTPLTTTSPTSSPLWHARQVCGISCSNPHPGSMVNSIQPLFTAGRLMSHASERKKIAELLQAIERETGWAALWRLRDLEGEWGYEKGGS